MSMNMSMNISMSMNMKMNMSMSMNKSMNVCMNKSMNVSMNNLGRSEKPKSWKSKNRQADYLPRHSPDVRTVFKI